MHQVRWSRAKGIRSSQKIITHPPVLKKQPPRPQAEGADLFEPAQAFMQMLLKVRSGDAGREARA